ncbi:UNVERIFIED_CONTAM: hypothetical protein Slati_4150200 [Sesamum latifolium]|uniref:Uncharacterized protein n=1 Tax=Sesamum latifolium TaxID=2727402 RepID=A0AAW2T8U7_9LAMI
MPLGGRPLAGEHDCRLILPFGTGSTDDDRELGAPGLPLVAEGGLSGRDVLRFGGTSRENPGISEGFHGLGLTVGELDRVGTGFFAALETGLATKEEFGDLTERAGALVALDTVVGLRVGVEALDVDFDAGIEDLLVGVEDLAVDLAVGVEDLGGTVGFAEDNVGREVGVADLEGLDVAVDVTLIDVFELGLAAANVGLFDVEVKVDLDDELKVGRPVGVAGLDPVPPEEDGLRSPPVEVFNPGDEVGCLDDNCSFQQARAGDWIASTTEIFEGKIS